MLKAVKIFLGILTLTFFSSGCIPDRLPPEPVPNTRPSFVSFGELDSSHLVIPVDYKIEMRFNWAMDLSTFPDNFTVESVSGKISGKFSYSSKADTIVVFTPNSNYNPAEYYNISLSGAVRNVNGMSMISPNEEDVPVTDWFFTEGEYSKNGFPLVFVRDKSQKQVIYRVGELNKYKDSLYVQATNEDYQTAAIEFSPIGKYLYMVNLKTTTGTVTVIDPQSFNVVNTINVGLGPTNIGFSSDKAFVTNTSDKSFTVFDLTTLNVLETVSFDDGFKPKDVVFSQLTGKLYFYSNSKKQIKIVNAQNYSEQTVLDSVLTDNKASDIEISADGKYIFLPEYRTDKIVIFDTETNKVAKILETGNPYVTDGVIGKDFYYQAYFKKIGKQNVGGIMKINVSTLNIEDVMMWDKDIDKLGLTSADELLYAVVPGDTTLQVIETKTLKNITEVKLNGSLKYLAVSKNNY